MPRFTLDVGEKFDKLLRNLAKEKEITKSELIRRAPASYTYLDSDEARRGDDKHLDHADSVYQRPLFHRTSLRRPWAEPIFNIKAPESEEDASHRRSTESQQHKFRIRMLWLLAIVTAFIVAATEIRCVALVVRGDAEGKKPLSLFWLAR